MKRSLGVALLVAALLLVGMVSSLGASFAGANGKIVFSRWGEPWDKPSGLFTAARGGTVSRLTRRSGGSPTWSPDGSRLAFVRADADGVTRIIVMNADGSGRHRVGSPSLGYEQGCGLQRPRWSYDGSVIAYTDDCFDQSPRVAQLRVAAADGSGEVDVTDFDSLNGIGPQPWSPDLEGSLRLTFTSNADGDTEVMTANSDGTDLVQLTNDSVDQFAPGWSPEGSSIVYSTQTVQGGNASNSLWLIDPAGGEPRLLEQGDPHSNDAVWSSDGTRLLIARRDFYGKATAVVMDSDGSNEVILGRRLDPTDAVWAPNDQAIAYSWDGNIFKIRLSDKKRIQLTTGDAYDVNPDWQSR